MNKKPEMHPGIPDLLDQHTQGKLSRREFIRFAALLGLSVGAAASMVNLSQPRSALASVQRGGTLKISSPIQKVTHPAQFSWVAPSQQLRQVAEYLTLTDENNVTHPYLLENWAVSDDLKTWTLNLRQGVEFNNGDPFIADDVIFTMSQWLDKDVGSSLLGMVGDYLDAADIERVNDHQVKLHLKRPEIGVPEHFFHYPAIVLNHRTFEGDFLRRPHGTGPYTLEAYREGERCMLRRRDGYWRKGQDGEALPYIDAVEFIDMGTEMAPQIAALQSGEIDMIDLSDAAGTDVHQVLKDDPGVNIIPVTTCTARVLRMRVDLKPWDDNRVRHALRLCQHREKILALAYFGQGLLAHDTHVYQNHPEYCPQQIPDYDPQQARQLLQEAGYPDGLNVDLAVGNDWSDVVRYAEILQQDAAPAGFRINIRTMPTSQYWEKWTEVDLGITPWTHRPLGTMNLSLAYTADEDGNPGAWNETRWVDEEFSALLEQANGTLDVDERRKIFCELQQIQMDRGSIGISYWQNMWSVTRKRVQNVVSHPNRYIFCADLWLSWP
ncbi:ABC transporter substrate-binding protein [Desulfonatronum parangueonense]